MCVGCVGMCSSMLWRPEDTFQELVLGIELRSPELVASSFACWALSVVLECLCVIPCLSLLWWSKDSLSALPFLCSKTAEWRHKNTLSFMRCSQLSSQCFTYWYSPQKAASSSESVLKTYHWKGVKHYLFTASVCHYWQAEPAFVLFFFLLLGFLLKCICLCSWPIFIGVYYFRFHLSDFYLL